MSPSTKNYIEARERVIKAIRGEVIARDEVRKARYALLVAREDWREEERQELEDCERIINKEV